MQSENDITIENLQLMIANLSLDNARLQARTRVLAQKVQELEAQKSGDKNE